MSHTIRAILLIAILAIGGGFIAITAYQAGVTTAVTTAVANGATVVAPISGYPMGYGYGWHPGGFGLGFLGFIGTLLFFFLFFGLIKAIVFRGGSGHEGGWGHCGYWGHRGHWDRRDEGGPNRRSESSNEPSAPTSGSAPA